MGAGSAFYLSTRLGVDELSVVLGRAYQDAGIEPGSGPAEVELIRRHGVSEYVIAVNHGGRPVELPVGGTDLLTGESGESLKLEAGAVRVIRI